MSYPKQQFVPAAPIAGSIQPPAAPQSYVSAPGSSVPTHVQYSNQSAQSQMQPAIVRSVPGPYSFRENDPQWICCCCAMHVITAAQLVAWTQLILSGLMCLILLLMIVSPTTAIDQHQNSTTSTNDTLTALNGPIHLASSDLFVMGTLTMLFILATIPPAVMVLIGCKNYSKNSFLPYLVMSGLYVCMLVVSLNPYIFLQCWFSYLVFRAYAYCEAKTAAERLDGGAANTVLYTPQPVTNPNTSAATHNLHQNMMYEDAPPSYDTLKEAGPSAPPIEQPSHAAPCGQDKVPFD